MQITENTPLAQYSTMRLGGSARYSVEVTSRSDVIQAHGWAKERGLPVIMIGAGSNIVWRDSGFAGLLLINKIMGYEQFEEDELNTYITVGAGENWDSVAARSAAAGLTGIEALSLIPGTTGATPVQNVGAYGQDISQTLVSVEVFDTATGKFKNIPVSECGLGYRTSRFKTTDYGRYFITSLTLHLTKQNPSPPFYRALQDYLGMHNPKASYSPQDIRSAVIAIRSQKLPDPAKTANNGSFFANPIIPEGQLIELRAKYPDIPHWPTSQSNQFKIPAAWLIEQAGLKDFHDPATGMATWKSQPLVLVNEHAKSTADLLAFKQIIVGAVKSQFGIQLVQEPELLPAESDLPSPAPEQDR